MHCQWKLFNCICDTLVPDVYTGLVTCLHLSNISVDWTSVAALENQGSDCGPTASCFRSSVVYACTLYSQLVQCRDGRLSTVVNLPFNDGILLKELESATRSTLFVVQSRRNMVAVVDVSKHQVLRYLCIVNGDDSAVFHFFCPR